MGHYLYMHPHVVIDLSLGVEVIDPDALAGAALARYSSNVPGGTPPRHVEEFNERIMTDPAVAVHQFLVAACEAAVGQIPGCRYVGSTTTQRLADPNEVLPWRHASS